MELYYTSITIFIQEFINFSNWGKDEPYEYKYYIIKLQNIKY